MEQLEQVWKRFSAKGPVNGSGKLYTMTIINTISNLGSPSLYVVVNNFHVVGKLPVVGLVYAKQFMSSIYTGPSFRKVDSLSSVQIELRAAIHVNIYYC